VLWLNVATDALIAAAQLSLAVGVVWFARRRPDIAFRPIFPGSAVFRTRERPSNRHDLREARCGFWEGFTVCLPHAPG